MSTQLLSLAAHPFSAGVTDSGPLAVPGGFRTFVASLSSDGWPAGTYSYEIQVSYDGGSTFFPGAKGTFISPFSFPAGFPHEARVGLTTDVNKVPTHAKAIINAPFAFTSTLTITAQ